MQLNLKPTFAIAAISLSLVLSPAAVADPEPVFSHPILTLESVTFSSPFGMRNDPIRNRPAWHRGVDIGGEIGAAIYTPADAIVTYAGTKAGYGKMVDVELSDGRKLRFAHLNEVTVTSGQAVSAGDEIGLMGSSGRNRPAHLHLELRLAEKAYNPTLIDGLVIYEGCCVITD